MCSWQRLSFHSVYSLLMMVSSSVAKLFNCVRSYLLIIGVNAWAVTVLFRKSLPMLMCSSVYSLLHPLSDSRSQVFVEIFDLSGLEFCVWPEIRIYVNSSPCRYLVDQHHVVVISPFLQCVLLTSLVIKGGYNCQDKFENFIFLIISFVTIIDDSSSNQSYS